MSYIKLEGLNFYAHHGYYTEERKRGNNYILDVEIDYDLEKAADTDDLEDALNYEEVYNICEEEMDNPRHLIEAVAKSIAVRVRDRFPHLSYVQVTMKKLKPQLGGAVASATICYKLEGGGMR